MEKIESFRKLYVKDFISIELRDKIGQTISCFPYLSFPLICLGIEFLGKCLDVSCTFEEKKYGHFEKCIDELMPKYSHLVKRDKNDNIVFDLKTGIRNGFAHQFRPSGKFTLCPITSHNKHLDILADGSMAIKIDELYKDFYDACNKMISAIELDKVKYPPTSKVHMVYTIIKPDHC